MDPEIMQRLRESRALQAKMTEEALGRAAAQGLLRDDIDMADACHLFSAIGLLIDFGVVLEPDKVATPGVFPAGEFFFKSILKPELFAAKHPNNKVASH